MSRHSAIQVSPLLVGDKFEDSPRVMSHPSAMALSPQALRAYDVNKAVISDASMIKSKPLGSGGGATGGSGGFGGHGGGASGKPAAKQLTVLPPKPGDRNATRNRSGNNSSPRSPRSPPHGRLGNRRSGARARALEGQFNAPSSSPLVSSGPVTPASAPLYNSSAAAQGGNGHAASHAGWAEQRAARRPPTAPPQPPMGRGMDAASEVAMALMLLPTATLGATIRLVLRLLGKESLVQFGPPPQRQDKPA